MPNTKRKVKFCKKLAADKKIKTSNQKIKNNVANIEIFNDNNDMETEENLEELLSNEAEEELTNNEIEIDENFEWFDNEIKKMLNIFIMFYQIILKMHYHHLIVLWSIWVIPEQLNTEKKLKQKRMLKKMLKH